MLLDASGNIASAVQYSRSAPHIICQPMLSCHKLPCMCVGLCCMSNLHQMPLAPQAQHGKLMHVFADFKPANI